MYLALGIILLWLGCAGLWIALHGIDAEDANPSGYFGTLGKFLKGEKP